MAIQFPSTYLSRWFLNWFTLHRRSIHDLLSFNRFHSFTTRWLVLAICVALPLSSARQQSRYGDCLEVKREYYENSSVVDCVTQNVHSLQHTYMSSSYRSNRLGLSHWPYTVRRGGYLELYYCNMVDWFWCDSSLILTTNWFPSVLWHCWFGRPACKNRPPNDLLCVEWNVKPYTLTIIMRSIVIQGTVLD